MRLWHAVFRGRIVGSSLERPQRSLTGDTVFELLLHFLCAALLERVSAAAQGQPCNCERK